MRNLKSTVIGAFGIFIAITVLSSAISFFGYTRVIDSLNNFQINKSRQDKLQQLDELSAKRQQIISREVISMNTGGNKELEEYGNKIDEIVKNLNEAGVSSEDKKTIESLMSINGEYKKAYAALSENINEFGNKNIPALSADIQGLYNDIKKTESELQAALAKSLETEIGNSLYDTVELNRKVNLIYSDSQSVDSNFVEIKKLLAEILSGLQETGNDSTIQEQELSQKIEALKQEVSEGANGTAAVLENSGATGFDRVYNMKKISNDLEVYQNICRLIAVTDKNNNDLMYTAVTYEDTASSFSKNHSEIGDLLKSISREDTYKEAADGLAVKYSSYNSAAQEIFKRAEIMRSRAIGGGYDGLVKLNGDFSGGVGNLRLSFNNYLADDIRTSENIKLAIFWIFIGVTLFSIVAGMAIALMLSKKITHPINSLSSILSSVEKGDLTVRADVKADNEIGSLVQQVNNVLDGQQRMLEQFKGTTGEISNLKQKLIMLVNQNRESIGRISGSKKSETALDNKTLDTQSILTDIRTVSEQAQKAAGDSIKAVELARSREKEAEEAESVINSVNETVKSIASSIAKLEASSGKIGEITNTITQIASQTNLLALNAAIEANRAGQQGKGFAVVADEIRKLSNASNNSAGEIKAQIKEIQSSISFAVEKMNMGVVGVEDSATRVNEVKEGITEIIESFNLVAKAIKASADKASTHYETTMQFVEALDGLAGSAEEEVSAGSGYNESMEIQMKNLKDIDQILQLLQEAADELKSISDSVKI